MRILAIETTAMTGSVALLENEEVVHEILLREDQRSAQSLAPTIQAAFAAVNWPLASIQLIAVAVGPGSFTGLRVGISTAKLLAYALKTEVMGLDTLEVLAAQAKHLQSPRIHAMLDAQRNELFVATFEKQTASNELMRVQETHIIPNATFISSLAAGDVLIGPVLEKLRPQLPPEVVLADPDDWSPRASTIGQLACRAYLAGRRDDVWKLTAQYHRASAAEEKVGK